MNKHFKKILVAVAAVLSVILVFTPISAFADHEDGHDTVARGGIKVLDEKVWNLETALPGINSSITNLNSITTNLQTQINALPDGPPGGPSVKTVACPSDSLQDAIDNGVAGDTFEVTGNCIGDITIDKDRIQLVGMTGATITGGSALGRIG